MGEALETLFGHDIDWLFWPALRMAPISGWYGHVPFAHWIIGATRPRVLVELGTHWGVSYGAFCNAVQRFDTGTRCYAVDTWVGDPHAGNYSEEVYADLSAFNARFAPFSTLLRMTFDEGLSQFEDGSIDLLHIDGFHTYEAVRHDFETWLPKLSDRAIVLFHDTAEHRGDFGVWRYWAELCERYPNFSFEHEHGLGVLQVGAALDGPALPLLRASDPAEIATIRERFKALGQNVRETARAVRLRAEVKRLQKAAAKPPRPAAGPGARSRGTLAGIARRAWRAMRGVRGR